MRTSEVAIITEGHAAPQEASRVMTVVAGGWCFGGTDQVVGGRRRMLTRS